MTLSTEQCLDAIGKHSAGLAAAARDHLDAPVRHCPGWDVADLVWHVRQVHWFWGTIVEELLSEPPAEDRRPARPAPERLVDDFEAGARRLVEVLARADQAAACWTWAPGAAHVAFVTRHQVQEAAVHHWDAADAGGGTVSIEPAVAADAVEEFLTWSVSSEADPADPPRPALDGALWFRPRDVSVPGWLVTDGPTPGTVAWRHVPEGVEAASLVPEGVPVVGGQVDPADVLLWLYARRPTPWAGPAPDSSADREVLDRFRALTYTD